MVRVASQRLVTTAAPETLEAQVTIGAARANPVDHRLFGQFLERASFGEPGPEGALDSSTGKLREDVTAIARGMRIPLIRFPGGTDIDYTDWRDLVDGAAAPGPRAATLTGHTGKSLGTRFGIDEYFSLRDDLGSQTILVVNLLDGLAKRLPLAEAAQRAAGLVAYANSPVGSPVPDGMRDWAALRAANGHPEPFKTEFVQLGNEWWCGDFPKLVAAAVGPLSPLEMAEWYRECLHAYIAAIRAVDPTVGIIIDGDPGGLVAPVLYDDAVLQREVAFVALHAYGPGPVDRVALAQSSIPPELLTADEWWWAWIGALGQRGDDGICQGLGHAASHLTGLGYRIACTEWNWNGYGFQRLLSNPGEHRVAAALGAATFLNGLLRQGAHVRLATQSMLVGTTWDIAAIRVSDGSAELRRAPTGLVTTLYARLHGRWRVDAEVTDVPVIEQPYALGHRPPTRIAAIDVVATADDRHLFVHAVNNDPHRPAVLDLDATASTHASGIAAVHRIVSSGVDIGDAAVMVEEEVTVTEGRLRLLVPAASIAIIEIARKLTGAP